MSSPSFAPVTGSGATAATKSLTKHLKARAVEFLGSPRNASPLEEILGSLKEGNARNGTIHPSMLALELVFTELFRRNDMRIVVRPLKPVEESSELAHKQWLQSQYKEAFSAILEGCGHERQNESALALATAMKLVAAEAQNPLEISAQHGEDGGSMAHFPLVKLKQILQAMLPSDRSNANLISRFQEYDSYLDVIYFCWKLLPSLAPKEFCPSAQFIQNFILLFSTVCPGKETLAAPPNFLCINNGQLDYPYIRKQINKTWACVMNWQHDENSHKQLLVLLLEKVLAHLDKPVLLTDFLMDSLDVGGAISLLALQGIFVLIQQHNLTYPNVYEKLYSMFEPEIFHTKFKARLFYLADIFLSSTHLPEGLVAAFIKRLARLALIAPPQDIVIILRFIGNLILRHPALKRLIFHPTGGEVSQDPFIMDESDPIKSNALDSSLWEVVTLQSHVLPSVATAAHFISNPFPSVEWDLASVLEINENDIFDKEISKKSKQYALSLDRPTSLFLSCGGEKFSQYWKLF